MDPNIALKNAREAVESLSKNGFKPGNTNKLLMAFMALDEWLKNGGFLPTDWNKGR